MSERKTENNGQSFGEFIREKRLKAPGILTQADLAERLNTSASHYADVESGRRRPLDKEKLEIFAKETRLSEEDRNMLYDLAAKYGGDVPLDLKDTFFQSEAGELARLALRKTKSGKITIEQWKRFIQEEENRK